MDYTIKNKLLITALVFAVCLFSANFSSASMHHMDDSDCMVQMTCSNCFISTETLSPDLFFTSRVVYQASDIPIMFETNQAAPPPPPPKI